MSLKFNPVTGKLDLVMSPGSGTATVQFDIDAATAPGTDPAVPTAGGALTLSGAVVAAHSVPVETHSRAANSANVEVQVASAVTGAPGNKNAAGLAQFDDSIFTVDADGYVSLVGGSLAIDSFSTDISGPVSPDATGNVDITGSNIYSDGTLANTVTLNTQATAHTFLLGAGSSTPMVELGPLTNGQLIIGATGNSPVAGSMTSSDGSVLISSGAGTIDLSVAKFGVDEDQIFYVGKHGNDGNSGLNIEEALLTFGAAITKANAETPGAANRIVIRCFDDGIYTENLTCVQYVDIDAPSASLVGTITLADDIYVKLSHQTVSTGNTGLSKTAGTGYSFVEIEDIDLEGNAIGLLCTSGYVNIKWKRMTVENGFGIGDLTAALEHIHVNGGDIYITGTGIAIGRANSGTTVGKIDHIIDTGGGSGTGCAIISGEFDLSINRIQDCSIGIDVNGGVANLQIEAIDCTTAYDVANGATLNLFCNALSGAKTTVGGSIVYEVILGTPIEVIQGGTGAATFTDHGILLGSGTDAITATAAPTNGQLLIGSTGNDPVLGTLTAPAAGITITEGAGSITFALGDDLSGLESIGTTGLSARTAANTWTTRTIVPPAAGITVSNGDGVAGNPTLALANDLAALEGLSSTGIVCRTAANTYAERTITGTGGTITVTNGDGVSGNPTLDFSDTPTMKQLTIDPGASGDSFIQFDINTTGEFRIGVDDDASDQFKISIGSALGTNDAMRVDANGIFTYPLQSGFLATATANQNNATGDGTTAIVQYNSEIIDQNSDYNTGTYTFTAPVTGLYQLSGSVDFRNIGSHSNYSMDLITSNRNYKRSLNPSAVDQSGLFIDTISFVCDMDAADTAYVQIYVAGSTKTVEIHGTGNAQHFSGCKIA